MNWSSFFQDGGVTMFPTLLSGFVLVAVSVLNLLRPQRRLLNGIGVLGVLTVLAGVNGFVMAMVTTVRHAGAEPAIVLQGAAESANNVVLALIFAMLASVLTASSVLRRDAL